METERCITKLSNALDSFKKGIGKDIEEICNIIAMEYDVRDRNDNEKIISKQVLYNSIMNYFGNDLFCCAQTANGSNCTRKAHANSKYCKIHIQKYSTPRTSITTHRVTTPIYVVENRKPPSIQPSGMIKKLINDSFYFIDEKYIYDIETHEKVGYIKNNEHVLTDDPFVLDELL